MTYDKNTVDDICHLGTDLIDYGCLGGNGRIDRTGAQAQKKAEN